MSAPLPLGPLVGWTLFAVAAAGFGALLGGRRLAAADRVLGWAGALAAGMMLGVGYASLSAGLAAAPLAALLGAAAGVCVVRLLDVAAPTSDGATAASALHSAAEGVAIGAAAALDARFGLFLVVTFTVHNVSEGAVLGATLTGAGRAPGSAVLGALAARTAQPLLAAAALLLVRVAPAALPWLLGASFGALLYLIVAELLPHSYEQAGRTGIALVFSVAAGVVALLGGRAQ